MSQSIQQPEFENNPCSFSGTIDFALVSDTIDFALDGSKDFHDHHKDWLRVPFTQLEHKYEFSYQKYQSSNDDYEIKWTDYHQRPDFCIQHIDLNEIISSAQKREPRFELL